MEAVTARGLVVIEAYGFTHRGDCMIPLFLSRVSAGFPSPADDYLEERLDLNRHLVPHPAATFFVRVSGQSMERVGIFHGDLLVVDRSREAEHKNVIIAVLEGELTVKRFCHKNGEVILASENEGFPNFKITPEMEFEVWGVVTYVIHAL